MSERARIPRPSAGRSFPCRHLRPCLGPTTAASTKCDRANASQLGSRLPAMRRHMAAPHPTTPCRSPATRNIRDKRVPSHQLVRFGTCVRAWDRRRQRRPNVIGPTHRSWDHVCRQCAATWRRHTPYALPKPGHKEHPGQACAITPIARRCRAPHPRTTCFRELGRRHGQRCPSFDNADDRSARRLARADLTRGRGNGGMSGEHDTVAADVEGILDGDVGEVSA